MLQFTLLRTDDSFDIHVQVSNYRKIKCNGEANSHIRLRLHLYFIVNKMKDSHRTDLLLYINLSIPYILNVFEVATARHTSQTSAKLSQKSLSKILCIRYITI